MDKLLVKFLADVLYLKEVICFEEYEGIMDIRNYSDMDKVFEKMMKEEYNAYRRGEIIY